MNPSEKSAQPKSKVVLRIKHLNFAAWPGAQGGMKVRGMMGDQVKSILIAGILTGFLSGVACYLGILRGRAEQKKWDEADCAAHPVVKEVPLFREPEPRVSDTPAKNMVVKICQTPEDNQGRVLHEPYCDTVIWPLVNPSAPPKPQKGSKRHSNIQWWEGGPAGGTITLPPATEGMECEQNSFGFHCSYPVVCRDEKTSRLLKGDDCGKEFDSPREAVEQCKPGEALAFISSSNKFKCVPAQPEKEPAPRTIIPSSADWEVLLGPCLSGIYRFRHDLGMMECACEKGSSVNSMGECAPDVVPASQTAEKPE